ncbi:hypothetical protein, partial [Escherichia coli]|uniref:hypothetical protein n=1 Tax=Escherichia coli TaxID=562 RepID=UPI001BC8410F
MHQKQNSNTSKTNGIKIQPRNEKTAFLNLLKRISTTHNFASIHLSGSHGRGRPAGTGSVCCGLGLPLSVDKPEQAVKLD